MKKPINNDSESVEHEQDGLISPVNSISSNASSRSSIFFTGCRSDSEDELDLNEQQTRAGAISTTISITSNIIGGGILALSNAFHQGGTIMSSILSLLCTLLCFVTAVMIVLCSEETRLFTFAQLWHYSFPGKKLTWLIAFFIIFQCFSTCVVFVVVIKDSMEPVARNWMNLHGFLAEGNCWILIVSPLLFILSSFRRLKELTWTSLIAFLTIMYVVVMVFVRYFQLPKNDRPLMHNTTINFNAFQVISTVAFALMFHLNIPAFYKELKHRSIRKMSSCIAVSLTFTAITYISVAIAGYATWGATIESHGGDLLAQYDDHDGLMNFGRFLMLFHFTFVFPLQAHTARRVFNIVVFGTERGVSQLLICIESACLVTLACLIAVYAPGISIVVSLNGALLGMNLVFTFPALIYMRVFPTMSVFRRVITYLLIFLGVTLTITTTYITVKQLFVK